MNINHEYTFRDSWQAAEWKSFLTSWLVTSVQIPCTNLNLFQAFNRLTNSKRTDIFESVAVFIITHFGIVWFWHVSKGVDFLKDRSNITWMDSLSILSSLAFESWGSESLRLSSVFSEIGFICCVFFKRKVRKMNINHEYTLRERWQAAEWKRFLTSWLVISVQIPCTNLNLFLALNRLTNSKRADIFGSVAVFIITHFGIVWLLTCLEGSWIFER